jgi:hypothetical protein
VLIIFHVYLNFCPAHALPLQSVAMQRGDSGVWNSEQTQHEVCDPKPGSSRAEEWDPANVMVICVEARINL